MAPAVRAIRHDADHVRECALRQTEGWSNDFLCRPCGGKYGEKREHQEKGH